MPVAAKAPAPTIRELAAAKLAAGDAFRAALHHSWNSDLSTDERVDAELAVRAAEKGLGVAVAALFAAQQLEAA